MSFEYKGIEKWKPQINNPVKLKQEIDIIYQLFERDQIEAERRPSALPPDWRTRVLRTYPI